MDAGKQFYLLLIYQGFYLGSVCQRWTFPIKLHALIGSCVEIPCMFDPDESLGTSSTVWYSYAISTYPEILNTKDASSVEGNYKHRTSLIPGNNSCTLRIDQVTEYDSGHYYPGIAEDKNINAYEKQKLKSVRLEVTDKVEHQLLVSYRMTEGNAAIMQCAVKHTCGSSPPSLRWNKPGTVKSKSVDLTGGYWSEESELTYIPSYVDDGTLVQCTATYLHDQYTMASSKLTIDYAPKNVTVTVIGMSEIKEGGNVTLECNSYYKAKIKKYEWHKGKSKTKLMESKQTMTIMNVTKDMDPYGCAAINHVGRGESDLIEIPVPYAATEVHITAKYESESTELTCVFLSSRPDVTHYTWMRNGLIVQNEEKMTLTIYNNEESYGQYLCIAHNSAGSSSSKEIHIKSNTVNLPLILGTVGGVFFLLLLIMVIYIYLRQNKKSTLPSSPIHGTVSARILYTKTKDENQYENIQRNHHAHTPSMGSQPSPFMQVQENYAIYSNSEIGILAMQPSNEVEYSAISHGEHDQVRLTSSSTSHAEVVEYASLKH